MKSWRDTRIEMMGENTEWVRVNTLEVMLLIRKYFRRHPKSRYLTINKLAASIGKSRKTTKTALHLMAYRKDPEVRIKAATHLIKGHPRVAYHIHPINPRGVNVGTNRRKKK